MDQAQTLARQLMKRFEHLFSGEEECSLLAKHFQEHEWDEGEELYRYGKESRSMHFVPRGALTVSIGSEASSGADILLAGGGDGTFVGELGLLRPGPSSATVRTATPLHTLELTHDTLVSLLTSKHRNEARAATHLTSAMGAVVAERLRKSSVGRFRRGPQGTAMFSAALSDLHGQGPVAPIEGLAELPPTLDATWSPTSKERKALDAKILEALRSEPELRHLGDAMLSTLSRMVLLCSAQPGDVILDRGRSAHGIYLVVEGEVRVIVKPQEGAETDFHVDRVLGPGEVFGAISYVLRRPPTARVEAAAPDTRLAVLSEMQITEFMRLGEAGLPIGSIFRLWIAGQLADDARALNERILREFGAWSAKQA